MDYHVIIQPKAWLEAEAAYRWIAEQSPGRATRWFNGLRKAVDSLNTHPTRCRLAPESEGFREEVRQLLYGRQRGIYRILFVIRGQSVYVVSIRHSARGFLTPEEIE